MVWVITHSKPGIQETDISLNMEDRRGQYEFSFGNSEFKNSYRRSRWFSNEKVSSMSLGSEENLGLGSLIIIQIIKVMRTGNTIK